MGKSLNGLWPCDIGDDAEMREYGGKRPHCVRGKFFGNGHHRLFFLPPYSPDLNPIEQAFAKLKTLLRNAAERTVEATCKRIGLLLNCFTPQECANYLANAGYAST